MAFPTIVSVTPVIAPANQTQVLYSNIACQPGDMLIVYVYHGAQSSGLLTETTGTWQVVVRQNGPFNNSMMAQKTALSSTETLTVNNGGPFGGAWGAILYVIRGANSTLTAAKQGNFNATTAGLGLGNFASATDMVLISSLTGANITTPPQTYSNLVNTNGSPYFVAASKTVNANQELSYAWNAGPSNWATYTTAVYSVPPVITSPSSYTVPTNTPATFNLVANFAMNGTWSIVGGANANLFTLSGSTLNMAGNPAGIYTVIVQITATDGQATQQTITVNVTDRNKVRWSTVLL